MSATPTIWIVDDDRSIRWVVERALTNASYACETFESADVMFEALRTDTPAVVVSDIRMPGTDGIELLGQLRESHPANSRDHYHCAFRFRQCCCVL